MVIPTQTTPSSPWFGVINEFIERYQCLGASFSLSIRRVFRRSLKHGTSPDTPCILMAYTFGPSLATMGITEICASPWAPKQMSPIFPTSIGIVLEQTGLLPPRNRRKGEENAFRYVILGARQRHPCINPKWTENRQDLYYGTWISDAPRRKDLVRHWYLLINTDSASMMAQDQGSLT